MRYQETKEYSAELLRLILPLMSSHRAAFHPISYTVWYEYVAGINPELAKVVDKMTEGETLLGEREIQELFRIHVAERDEAQAEKFQAELGRLMDELTVQAGSTGKEAEKYGDDLTEYSGQLKRGVDPAGFSKIVDALIEGTRSMQGSVSSLQGTLSDGVREVQVLKAALKQAIGEALTDPLTGLRNRRAFDRQLATAMEEVSKSGQEYCLLLLDVDHFKKINDTYGHVFGDKVLRSISHVLQTLVKGRDVVARFGGEEFAVLLPETGIDGARAIAEKIREAIAKGRIRNTENSAFVGNITISIGVAICRAGEDAEALIGRADQALYASKNNGRNRVTVASEATSKAA